MPHHLRPLLLGISAIVCLSACSGSPQEADIAAPDTQSEPTYGPLGTEDPYTGFNKGVFRVNKAVDRYVLDPVVAVYDFILPGFVRKRLANAYDNLNEPLNFVHNMLQGNPDRAGQNLGRFMINSVWGLGGLFDVAAKGGVQEADEDLGQTLAVWGVPSGPYLVLPLFGPSTARDAFGLVGVNLANPFGFVVGGQFGVEVFDADTARFAVGTGQTVQARSSFDQQVDQLYSLSVEEGYTLARSGYLQQRCFAIYNNALGSCEEEDDLFDEEFDEFGALQLRLGVKAELADRAGY